MLRTANYRGIEVIYNYTRDFETYGTNFDYKILNVCLQHIFFSCTVGETLDVRTVPMYTHTHSNPLFPWTVHGGRQKAAIRNAPGHSVMLLRHWSCPPDAGAAAAAA
jgi:hypothetical protein